MLVLLNILLHRIFSKNSENNIESNLKIGYCRNLLPNRSETILLRSIINWCDWGFIKHRFIHRYRNS
ncbi:hypothetical protein TrispH2_009116 [Trichoplax sp. H2]|nr:hypothetical protein TrispH2_009116 [Trichoplax sp. H2]|eukprot:RDD39656.1 hypothetical protein TrispH2_009116 [Trichoplax sp. H2]